MKPIEENIKLALYGAGCTQEYAEKQTDELLKIIQKHIIDKAVLREYFQGLHAKIRKQCYENATLKHDSDLFSCYMELDSDLKVIAHRLRLEEEE